MPIQHVPAFGSGSYQQRLRNQRGQSSPRIKVSMGTGAARSLEEGQARAARAEKKTNSRRYK